MKDIALAIVCVGLCCYQVYRYVEIHKRMMIDVDIPPEKAIDVIASCASIIAFIGIFFV